MRAAVGLVVLLVSLALVGWLATRQLKSVVPVLPAASAVSSSPMGTPASATAATQIKDLEDRVKTDVTKALEQGAARRSDADQ